MRDVVLIAIQPRRVIHIPTGDAGVVLGVDADGYQVVQFDGEHHPVSLRDNVLTEPPSRGGGITYVNCITCERVYDVEPGVDGGCPWCGPIGVPQ